MIARISRNSSATQRILGASCEPPTPDLLGDFRLFLDDTSIVGLVEQSADEVASRLPQWRCSGAAPVPRSMLGLLTYSYLICRFASDDIAQSCKSDPVAKYLVGGHMPNDEVIRAFRRANRPWIEQCLAGVISKVADQPAALLARAQVNPVNQEFLSDSPALQLARRRVELATLFDMAISE
ncbi:MAG: hypothetical protein ACP5MD_02155 [Verrucomicrobiia bacterium]